jgi:alkylated DNA repair dioxygenase AlkB
MPLRQPSLFEPALPEGFVYRRDFLSPEEERALVADLSSLEFKPFEFQGFLGKRRVVSFGWRYDFNQGGLKAAGEIPGFLRPLQDRASDFAGLPRGELHQLLVTEYAPGAAIGWHRDRSVFAEVVGISLLAPCNFRFRRRRDAGWERAALTVEPRSAYLLTGPARSEWEHSIPPVETLRYSLTFRRLKPYGPNRT